MKYEEGGTPMEFYNFVIVGGGPAGLTASIVAARNGFKVLVVEKGDIAGPKPRGEGIRHFPLLDEILGDGFLPSIGNYSAPGSVFHSPGNLHSIKIPRKPPKNYFFHWRPFIDRFVEIAKDLGIEIRTDCEVIEPINKDGICVGVKYKDKSGSVMEVFGNAILGCDGFESVIGRAYNINYEIYNCPIMKCLVSNGNIDVEKTPCLQFYFIGNGDIDFAPKFPQSVAYVFPIGGTNLEIGLMCRMMKTRKMKTVEVPDKELIEKVWEWAKRELPGFSKFLKGAKIEYEELTAITNAKLVKDYIPNPGAVLIGDSAGFVESSGSSGLYFSIAMAKFWVDILGDKLKAITDGKKNISENIDELWSAENIKEFKSQWSQNKVNKHIKKVYTLVGIMEWYVFKRRRTAERINKKWKLISWMLRKGL